MIESSEFIKMKTAEIQKHITKEHQKLVERFIAFKSRTKERVDKNDEMERTIIEMTMKEALEEPAKEAMYAMDSTNPL